MLTTNEFWASERAARWLRFGKMTPELFEYQQSLAPNSIVNVDVMVAADVPQPQRPYDGTDQYVSIEAYESWLAVHSLAQQQRIAAAKAGMLHLLESNGATLIANPRGLPTIRAAVPRTLLLSQALNASNVVRIDAVPTDEPVLLGYAGRASMNAAPSAGGLQGGCAVAMTHVVTVDRSTWGCGSGTRFQKASRAWLATTVGYRRAAPSRAI